MKDLASPSMKVLSSCKLKAIWTAVLKARDPKTAGSFAWAKKVPSTPSLKHPDLQPN
jgi:hypothetical protein